MADEGLAASLGATVANGLPWDKLRGQKLWTPPTEPMPTAPVDPNAGLGTLLTRSSVLPPQPPAGTVQLNAPTGDQLRASPPPSPSERVTQGLSSAFSTAGADNYTANNLASKLMGLVQATPLSVPLGAMDTMHAKSQGDNTGVVMGMAGMIPGVKPGAQVAKQVVKEAAPAAKSIAEELGLAVQGPASAIPIKPGDVRVSTRFPTAVSATENPLTHHLSIGTEEMRNAPGYEHNVQLLSRYPGFRHLRGMSDEEAVAAYLDQARGNMQYLYNRSPDEMKARSPLWYEGANEISGALANRWNVPRPAASGALASLSPQMDWYKNASLGERVGDIMTSAAAGRILTPDMRAFGRQADFLEKPEMQQLFRSIQGKSLDQLETPLQKALWIRLYDEAHNPRAYRSVTPEGNFGDWIRTQEGEPAKVGWGALGEIQKAVRSMESGGNMDIISGLLGTKHKVRNFYNNIEVPNDPRFGDITADTHQVAAAQLRPLSGTSPAVAHSLGSSLATAKQPYNYRPARGDSVTGVQGTYGLTADATRMMAMENDMLPRAAQSATWEPVRELFSPSFKADKSKTAAVDRIWREYDRGNISLDQARDRIFDFAGGIGTPSWARPGLRVSAPTQGSTYR
jgi:hypothetical protein